jgi:protein pelota
MKLLSESRAQGIIKVLPEHLEDLWCLSTIIDAGDEVTGTTFRKIAIGDSSSENAKMVKKPMTVSLSVTKVVFSDAYLKIQGTISSGPDDIPKGSHQSINLEPQHPITIKKEWLSFQRVKLLEAVHSPKTEILACVFDREQSLFARLVNNSFLPFLTLTGDVEKKGDARSSKTDFFEVISSQLEELNKRFFPSAILCGSSHFWKQNLERTLSPEIKKKVVFASVGDVTSAAFSELLSRSEVQSALSNVRASQDARLVEELFSAIGSSGNIAYGIKDVLAAAEIGAVDKLLCSEKLIKKYREDGAFSELEKLFKITEENKGSVILLSGDSDATKRLDGLGGVAAFLRFSLST